jgi:hypothetical protein
MHIIQSFTQSLSSATECLDYKCNVTSCMWPLVFHGISSFLTNMLHVFYASICYYYSIGLEGIEKFAIHVSNNCSECCSKVERWPAIVWTSMCKNILGSSHMPGSACAMTANPLLMCLRVAHCNITGLRQDSFSSWRGWKSDVACCDHNLH